MRICAGWWGNPLFNDAFTVNTSEGLDRALDHMPQPYKQVVLSPTFCCAYIFIRRMPMSRGPPRPDMRAAQSCL